VFNKCTLGGTTYNWIDNHLIDKLQSIIENICDNFNDLSLRLELQRIKTSPKGFMKKWQKYEVFRAAAVLRSKTNYPKVLRSISKHLKDW